MTEFLKSDKLFAGMIVVAFVVFACILILPPLPELIFVGAQGEPLRCIEARPHVLKKVKESDSPSTRIIQTASARAMR